MPNYNEYLMRHGEFGVQALVEQIERNEGIKHKQPVCLETRWTVLMRSEQKKAA
jgi:hypothetical protein